MPSADPHEVAKFTRLAPQWWDESGPMRPLHSMNPLRIAWIDARLPAAAHILDIGCGAGIAAEALARHGHTVLGMDAAEPAIQAARAHAEGQNLSLTYRAGAAEDLQAESMVFDAVTALEVIEHVQDQPAFLHLLASLTRPGGKIFISTLNRTLRSLAVAKIGAEYIARLLPAGTHDWRRFLPPEALAAHARAAGLCLYDLTGLEMSPLTGHWRATGNVGMNYLAAFTRQ